MDMGEQENVGRFTCGAKKRAAAAVSTSDTSIQPPSKKTRVVLGELTNLSNVAVNSRFDDPQMCAVYASDIYEYLHSLEVEEKWRPVPDYIEKIQKSGTTDMRCILVDWLVEVAENYKLVSDTLYLTVSYLDRFLSSKSLNHQRFQLLGVSCMLIAAKYEEINQVKVEDLHLITNNTCSKEEMIKMENEVLQCLKFEMGNPTTKTFLGRFTRAAQEDYKSCCLNLEFLGCYLAELSLLDYSCIRFLPSLVAASVIFLAKFTIQPKEPPWSSTLERYSGYKPSHLKDCVMAIHDIQLSRKGSAIRDKYKDDKFMCVSTLTSPAEIPTHYFEDVEALLQADPFDVEAQRKIEAAIRQVMLYVDMEVNGVPLKAFVDSGAQSTIISKSCAERCGLLRLLDQRYKGIAHGVGQSEILGRIHVAPIKIGDVFYPCSFTVLDAPNMEFLFGLDMLGKHQCIIDLKDSVMRFGGGEVSVPFLQEKDIPSHFLDEERYSKQDSESGLVAETSGAKEKGSNLPTQSQTSSGGGISPTQGPEFEAKVTKLAELGFGREAVIRALNLCGGNEEQAAVYLFGG